MTKGIHKHAISDPKPDITKSESLADYTDEERENLYYWVEAVNDENTILGFREWLATIDEDEY